MGLFSFVKDAGAKLFGRKEEEERASDKDRNNAMLNHIKRFNLRSESVTATLNGSTVILEGKVDTLKEKNRIVMAAGNIRGIDQVDDRVEVEEAVEAPENQFYTVVSGDYLSKIAKKVYGDSSKYNVIFEANQPMLEDPDKIYPGQVLVIPSLEA